MQKAFSLPLDFSTPFLLSFRLLVLAFSFLSFFFSAGGKLAGGLLLLLLDLLLAALVQARAARRNEPDLGRFASGGAGSSLRPSLGDEQEPAGTAVQAVGQDYAQQ